MQIRTIGYSADNYCYLVSCKATKQAILIDPGSAAAALSALQQSDLLLKAIFCTHHHSDHTAGINKIKNDFNNLPVYGNIDNPAKEITQPRSSDTTLQIGSLQITIIHTPGHTLDSVCFHINNALFTGDTLFGAGCGRMFEGTAEQFYNSISKISVLPEETALYFGHEYTLDNLEFAEMVDPDNNAIKERKKVAAKLIQEGKIPVADIALEKKSNPFLRCHKNSIKKQLPLPIADSSPVEIFAYLRNKKNSF